VPDGTRSEEGEDTADVDPRRRRSPGRRAAQACSFSVSGGLVALGLVATATRDLEYARRIALLRGYYFDEAPELSSYLMRVPGPEPLDVLGLRAGRWQAFRTVAAMVALITAVLAGSATGLLTAVASEHSLAAALVAGGVVAVAALAAMMRLQESAWERATSAPVSFDSNDTGPVQR
jgi:hypothetical protein